MKKLKLSEKIRIIFVELIRYIPAIILCFLVGYAFFFGLTTEGILELHEKRNYSPKDSAYQGSLIILFLNKLGFNYIVGIYLFFIGIRIINRYIKTTKNKIEFEKKLKSLK